MPDIKHVGRIKANGKKVIVAYRTLPGESDSALIVLTESLPAEQHDAIISLVESNAGQNSYEFAEAMARSRFPDGRVMLNELHYTKRLLKVKTSDVEMLPNVHATIELAQLNQIIAEQRGISVNDLALGNGSETREIASVSEVPAAKSDAFEVKTPTPPVSNEPLSDEDLAKKFRSDADRLSKEAAELRRQAEVLVPTKKKTTIKDE